MLKLNELLLHPHTAKLLGSVEKNPAHGYIFSGVKGTGKFSAAIGLIANRHPEKQHLIQAQNWEDLYIIAPLKGKRSIGIDQIKQAEQLIKLAHTRDSYIVVDGAEKLTVEAQNAFLKTLEEPPDYIHIFLVVHEQDRIMPTIRSRAQQIQFSLPSREDLKQYLQTNYRPDNLEIILNVSQAVPGLAVELAKDKESMRQTSRQLDAAKKLLSAPLNEKLLLVNSLNKEQALDLLQHLKVVTGAALRATAVTSPDKAARWALITDTTIETDAALQKNANLRLVMTNLVLNL